MPRRRDQLLVLLAGLVPVGLAIAINVATGGQLPRALAPYGAWAWPAVGILAMASAGLTAWQLLQQGAGKSAPEDDGAAAGSYVDQAGASIAGRDLYQYQLGPHVGVSGEMLDKVVTVTTVHGGVRVTAKSNRSFPAQLPLDIADFTGREDELAALRRYVARQAGSTNAAVTVLTIKGKPGIGKSALAIHFAHEVRPQFPDAQLYASLRGTDPEPKRAAAIAVLGQLLRALGVQDAEIPAALEDASARYRSELAGRRALVVLDNAADEAQVRPLLPGSPGCVVLITSRGQLDTVAGGASLSVDVLPESDAIALLARLGGEDRIAADPAAATSVARYCGHLPLALRIAGAKLRARPTWPTAELAARLADERRRLEELRVGDLGVRASFALSYQSLAPLEARVFRLLGLLDGPDMAPATVAALAEITLHEAEATLESLLDAHLLEQAVFGRYRFHDLLRIFACERAEGEEPRGARAAAVERVLRFYIRAAVEAANLLGPAGRRHEDGDRMFADRAAALAWLDAERGNLVAAITQAERWGGDDERGGEIGAAAWKLAGVLFGYFDLCKQWPDWEMVNEAALRAAQRAGDRASTAQVLHDLGAVYRQQRRFDEAARCLKQSLTVFRETGDYHGEATALMNLGLIHADQRHFDQAIRCNQQSLDVFKEIGDRYGEGMVLGNLGEVYAGQRRFDEAVRCYGQDLAIRRAAGDRRGEGGALHNLGVAYAQQGRLDDAVRQLNLGKMIYREVGDHYREGRILHDLGLVCARQGRFDEALEACEASLAIRRELGDRHGEAMGLYALGRVRVQQRRLDEAARPFEQSLVIFREMDDRHAEALALLNLGMIADEAQDSSVARTHWIRALSIFEALRAPEADEVRALLDRTA